MDAQDADVNVVKDPRFKEARAAFDASDKPPVAPLKPPVGP